MERPDTTPLDKKSALAKAEHYCAYQERSQQEIRDKLYGYGLLSLEVEEVIAELIENNFLNEERFALAYTLGKFRIKGRGKMKIKMALKQKRVPPKMIEKSLKQIDGEEYARKLKEILDKKDAQLKESDDWKRKQKLISYALTKGYERDLILDALTIS